jgi:hypothetical protein
VPTLTNLMTNPSFSSNDFTGWTSGSLTSRAIDNGGDGYRAGIVAAAQSGRLYQAKTGLTVGRKYYFRATMLGPTTDQVYCGINISYQWVSAPNSEEVLSAIYTATATSHTVQFADYRASGWDAIYGDRFILVDLTAAYGAGGEPDKATCDAWPFFETTWDTPEAKSATDTLLVTLTETAIATSIVLTATKDGAHIDLSWS